MATIPVEITQWRASEKELMITAKIPLFGVTKTLHRVRDPKGWIWRVDYNPVTGAELFEMADALVEDHPILSRIADYYDLKTAPKVDLRTLERELRAG